MNYEDPNYNVAMPIFVIHGNHDDPSGEGNLSPIDILATAGLVNYFGKTASVDDINIVPILLKKGETRLALYGLGGIRDERLHRTFLQKKVRMMRPIEDDAWFNLMILHQNRVPHGPTNYIPETFLDDFLDLVVWGHEHESQACDPTVCTQRGFMVCQPGSSVATSLCEGEAKRKHVVVLKVSGTSFEMQPIPLKSIRPFITRDVALRGACPRLAPADQAAINSYLCAEVDGLIEAATAEWAERNPDRAGCPLPLVRVRVDCSLPADEDLTKAYAVINPQRFGQQYINRVANPRDILHYLRKKGGAAAMAAQRRQASDAAEPEVPTAAPESLRVEDLVQQYLGCQKLDIFAQNEFGDILRTSIEKTDNGLIEKFITESIRRAVQQTAAGAQQASTDLAVLRSEFERVKRGREDEWHRLHPTIDSVLINVGEAPASRPVSDDEQAEERPSTAAVRGRARGRGRGRGGAAAGRAASKRAAAELASDADGDENMHQEEANYQAAAAAGKQQLVMEAAPTPARAPAKPAPAWPPRRR